VITEALPAPARLTIYRTHNDDVRQRQVIGYLDDQPKVTPVFGDSFTREIVPGRHSVPFNTLVRETLEFDAGPGEQVEIDVVNHPGRMTLGLLSQMGVASLFLRVERRHGSTGSCRRAAEIREPPPRRRASRILTL